MNAPSNLPRRAAAEGLGTALLLTMVVGSGIMAARLSAGNVAIALLVNALATGSGLCALILAFSTISGAHFNPAVTVADAMSGRFAWRDVPVYVAVQIAGAYAGVLVAHLMFELAPFSTSAHARTGAGQWLGEFVATFGLVGTIWACSRRRAEAVPVAVATYITAAYWFTSSTSFANPAVTLARAATDTFAGIRPADAPGFVAAQLAGTLGAVAFFRWLIPAEPR